VSAPAGSLPLPLTARTAHDLIDEYRIYVQPVLLGRGRPLFGPSDITALLRLAETRAFGNGVVLLRYERPRA
jgi:riboflavin biosynthesis pyrimidine reductase